MMDIVVFGGCVSGHDVDKWQAAGLTAVQSSKVSVPLIGEAIGNVEYRVIKQIPFDDGMDLFVGEALATHMRKGVMEGELYREDATRSYIWAPSSVPTAKLRANITLISTASAAPIMIRRC